MRRIFNRHLLSTTLILMLPALSASAQTTIRDISNQQVNQRQLAEAIASRTLTWLTGGAANNDYISVGRMANFFGFVALRVSSGQSLTRSAVAQDTLAALNEDQREILIALLENQRSAHTQTLHARAEMNRALEGLLIGDMMTEAAFIELGRTYGAAEAQLGRVIGQQLGDLAQTLTHDQQTHLMAVRVAHSAGQGDDISRDAPRLQLAQEDKQELVNLAARFLSWTTGTEDLNDFEVVGKPSQHFGFVSLRIESNHGVRRGGVATQVLDLLTPAQREILTIASAQNATDFDTFLTTRAQLMRELERALTGNVINRDTVQTLGAAVGAVEARMTWAQAQAMLSVRDTLSADQSTQLLAMRARYTGDVQADISADPLEHGRQLFAQCSLCHSTTGHSAVGPDLSGIVGRDIASDPRFDGYSPSMQGLADEHGIWSEALLDSFLASPRGMVSGTFMGFDGLAQEQDRQAIISYLKTVTD